MRSFVRARKCVELGLHFNQNFTHTPIQMHLTLFVAFMSPPCSSRVKTSSGDCTIWSGVFPASSTTIEASQGFELSQDCIALESESYCPMHVKGGGGGSTGWVLRIKLQRPELMKEIRIYESVRERLVGCDLVTGYQYNLQG